MKTRIQLLLFVYLTAIFLIVPVLNGLSQDKTVTPDGNSLPRGSWQNVRSTIPSPASNAGQDQNPELPCISDGETIIRHTGYTLSYDRQHRQSRWVAYELTAEETRGTVKRVDRFVPDPEVPEGSATVSDYKGTGYDKGHLAPSADMCWSEITMKESFYLSNMSPQVPGFNRGIWKNLETLVRIWAVEDSVLYIITGGVLEPGLPAIGTGRVSVPRLFYKVVATPAGKEAKGIGFVIPNKKTTRDLRSFVVSIDSVEILTGIDFFCQMPDVEESQIERQADTSVWNWSIGKGSRTSTSKDEED